MADVSGERDGTRGGELLLAGGVLVEFVNRAPRYLVVLGLAAGIGDLNGGGQAPGRESLARVLGLLGRDGLVEGELDVGEAGRRLVLGGAGVGTINAKRGLAVLLGDVGAAVDVLAVDEDGEAAREDVLHVPRGGLAQRKGRGVAGVVRGFLGGGRPRYGDFPVTAGEVGGGVYVLVGLPDLRQHFRGAPGERHVGLGDIHIDVEAADRRVVDGCDGRALSHILEREGLVRSELGAIRRKPLLEDVARAVRGHERGVRALDDLDRLVVLAAVLALGGSVSVLDRDLDLLGRRHIVDDVGERAVRGLGPVLRGPQLEQVGTRPAGVGDEGDGRVGDLFALRVPDPAGPVIGVLEVVHDRGALGGAGRRDRNLLVVGALVPILVNRRDLHLGLLPLCHVHLDREGDARGHVHRRAPLERDVDRGPAGRRHLHVAVFVEQRREARPGDVGVQAHDLPVLGGDRRHGRKERPQLVGRRALPDRYARAGNSLGPAVRRAEGVGDEAERSLRVHRGLAGRHARIRAGARELHRHGVTVQVERKGQIGVEVLGDRRHDGVLGGIAGRLGNGRVGAARELEPQDRHLHAALLAVAALPRERARRREVLAGDRRVDGERHGRGARHVLRHDVRVVLRHGERDDGVG